MRKLLLLLLFPTLAFAQTQHDRIDARGQVKTDKFINRATIILTGATPDVSGGNIFTINNLSPVTVTNLLGGVDTHTVTIECGEANSTFQNNANLVNAGGTDFVCGANKTISYIYFAAQAQWVQSGTGSAGGGGGGSPGAPANCLQKNNGAGGFGCASESSDGTNFVINENTQIKGPNPIGADVSVFGKFTTLSSTTANTTSGSANVVIAAASSFKNGEYVTVFNAGAACGLSNPTSPTVTPSVNSGGVNTTPATAGASSFAYQVVAADKFGCYTLASASGSTSTGNTLGLQSRTITTLTRANNIVTGTTSAAHGFVVGQVVHIKYFTTGDGTFEGFWVVASTPTSTTFTFGQGWDTRFGATFGTTGGTVIGFNANRVSWTAVTNAWKYYIYGRTGGVFSLLGVTYTNKWVDYGSPMNDSQSFPAFIPTTAPVAGANDHLTAQILSGAGSTTLTLSSNAGATLSGVAAKSDDGPAFIAAANSAARVYIPAQGITINSYTALPSTKLIQLAGDITVNDTLALGSVNSLQGITAGSGQSFASDTYPGIVGSVAYPQLLLSTTDRLSRISMRCNAANGCLQTLDTINAVNLSFDYVDFVSSAGTLTDYLGMNSIFQGGSFGYRYNKCLFTTGVPGVNDNTNIGGSPIPSILFTPRPSDSQGTGNVSVKGSWFTNRAAMNFDSGLNGYTWILMDDIQTQSQVTPIIEFTGTASLPGAVNLQNFTGADRATGYVANYAAGSLGTPVSFTGGTCPIGSRGSFTGNPVLSIVTYTAACLGQNTGLSYLGGGFSTDGLIFGSVIGFPMALPATAPSAAVSAGGAVPLGTWTFGIIYADSNGNLSGLSLISPGATTTGGNQTITITRPGTIPAGAVSWAPYASNGGGYARVPCSFVSLSSTTYLWNNTTTCGVTVGTANASTSSLTAGGVSAPTLTLVNGGFTSTLTPGTLTANRANPLPDGAGPICVQGACAVNAVTINGDSALSSSPRPVASVLFPGALTTTWAGASWTLDKAITVTRVQSAVKVVPAGCSTSAIVRVSDGSTPINLTINAATNDSGVITQNYAAGATLTVSVQTAAAGCTTSPGDLNLSVQSRMQ